MEVKVDTYKTNSLPLVSYLKCNDDKVEFVGVDDSDPTKIFFLFSPVESARDLSTLFYSGKAVADPAELFKNHKVLKDMVFELKKNVR